MTDAQGVRRRQRWAVVGKIFFPHLDVSCLTLAHRVNKGQLGVIIQSSRGPPIQHTSAKFNLLRQTHALVISLSAHRWKTIEKRLRDSLDSELFPRFAYNLSTPQVFRVAQTSEKHVIRLTAEVISWLFSSFYHGFPMKCAFAWNFSLALLSLCVMCCFWAALKATSALITVEMELVTGHLTIIMFVWTKRQEIQNKEWQKQLTVLDLLKKDSSDFKMILKGFNLQHWVQVVMTVAQRCWGELVAFKVIFGGEAWLRLGTAKWRGRSFCKSKHNKLNLILASGEQSRGHTLLSGQLWWLPEPQSITTAS